MAVSDAVSDAATDAALLPATEQRRLIGTGELSAVELLDACLARFERHNPDVNAVVFTELDAARAAAREADAAFARGDELGPLHGLPMTIKDSIDVAGMPSTWGNPLHADHRPIEDADLVKQLKAAGAIVYGKTNVPKHLGDWQTFNEIHGRTNNPWDVDRSPGGSSGGSAASVATGMASLEVGSDIGGSIRWPANYQGLVGLKPSYGLVSQHGHTFPGHEGMVDNNVVGPIARTVADLSMALPVLWEPYMSPPPCGKTSLSEFTVGVLLDNPIGTQDDVVTATLQTAVDQLVDAGIRVTGPPELDLLVRAHEVGLQIGRAAASGPDDPPTDEQLARYDAGIRDRAALTAQAHRLTYRQWIDLDNQRERDRLALRDWFRDVDLLLTPVTPTTAPPHDTERPFNDRTIIANGVECSIFEQWFWASMANPTYLPALAIPVGLIDGMPIGMQAVGPYMGDLTALRFGELAQAVLGHPIDELHRRIA